MGDVSFPKQGAQRPPPLVTGMLKEQTRRYTISTRVTLQEKLALTQKAASAGRSANEYYRDILLREYRQPDELKLLAAEVRAMRSILFQLVSAALAGQRLTDSQIREIVATADQTKYDRAEESLAQLLAAKERGAA